MNAIGYAHYQLNGGTRRLLRWTAAVAVLATIGLMLWSRVMGGVAATAGAARFPLSLALAGLLVILCNIRAGGAVRRDAMLDMSRSHRLMPQSTTSAVLGYIFGPSLPVLAAAGVIVLIGSICAVIAGGNPATWLTICLILVVFAAMTWCFTVAASFGGKDKKGKPTGGIGWIPWAVLGPLFGTGGLIFAIAPFVAVLLGPLAGRTVFAVRRPDQITWAHLASGAIQIAFAMIFFAAACRRYRRDDVPALGAPLWLAVIALIVIASILGIEYFDYFRPGMFDGLDGSASVAMPATLALLLLLLTAPVSANESESTAWRYRRNVGDPFADESKPALASWQVLAMFLLLCTPLAVIRPTFEGGLAWTQQGMAQRPPLGHVLGLTGASFLCGALLIWALVRIHHRLGAGGGYLRWLVFGLWVAPLIVAGMWTMRQTGDLSRLFNPAISFSTPGGIIVAWNGLLPEGAANLSASGLQLQRPLSFWPGVVFQALIAIAAIIVALRVRDRSAEPASRE